MPAKLVLLLLTAICAAGAAQMAVRDTPGACVVEWRGDEQIDVSVGKAKGLLGAPVDVRVDARRISFDGFRAVFNGLETGYSSQSVRTRCTADRVLVEHVLANAGLPKPVTVSFSLWMSPDDKALRIQASYPEGEFHLDRLSLGNHRGSGLEARRMFLGRMLVLEGPIQTFEVKHNYNMTRYWCFTMNNGLTEMQATDVIPRAFAYDPAAGRYDLATYCDSPITYTFVFTGKGPQEAITQYRSTVRIPAPSSLAKLPGRVLIMAAHPIRERYEDFLDELTSRGMRDFIWLSYNPAPSDRAMVEPFGALYAIYDMYTDLFAEGSRKAENWTPEWALFTRPGRMMRGYWRATRALPHKYVYLAKTRVQGTLGYEMENRGFLPSPATRYSNLVISSKELRPNALYLDVHSSKTPMHYWDSQGKHYAAREYLKYEKELFDFARELLGNAPILSEGNGEAFAGIMDGGIFMDWPTPETLKISCRDWDYYPNLDQVHRGRLLSVGFHWPLNGPDAEELSLATLFGRQHSINAYWGSPQTDPGKRAQVYYLTSAFHRMLGLARLERVDFAGDDIHRPTVTFGNGARSWVNRGKTDWQVEGYSLPSKGYLVTGPDGFLQHRSWLKGNIVEVVRSRNYQYFAAEKSTDFGPMVLEGALASRAPSPGRVVLYELVKPRGEVKIRLGQLPGTASGEKVRKFWILMTRGRKLEVPHPLYRQEADEVRFTAAEMATTVGYEIEFGR